MLSITIAHAEGQRFKQNINTVKPTVSFLLRTFLNPLDYQHDTNFDEKPVHQ